VGDGKIPVDRQRALTLADALVSAIAVHPQHSHCTMGIRTVRPEFERLAQVGLGGAEPPAVFGKIVYDQNQVDPRSLDQRVDIV
jgi:hypothetical protein